MAYNPDTRLFDFGDHPMRQCEFMRLETFLTSPPATLTDR